MMHTPSTACRTRYEDSMLLLCCVLVQLWDVEKGTECLSLTGHTAEIVSVCFDNSGNLVVTGSFDHDSRLWDVRTGQCVHVLSGHRGEVSSTVFNYSGRASTTRYCARTRCPAG